MSTETNMEKQNIRKKILEVRDGLSLEKRNKAATLMTERILGHQWFYGAEDFLCFVSRKGEIDTWEIISEALRMGKRVFVPKVILSPGFPFDLSIPPEDRAKMKFCRINTLADLSEGFHGIMEPAGRLEEYDYKEERMERTLMLMPGVAFDKSRNRLGYGGGFYDRFLADKPQLQLRTIAVGYKCQMVDELPAEENDIKPYQVICV